MVYNKLIELKYSCRIENEAAVIENTPYNNKQPNLAACCYMAYLAGMTAPS